MSQDGAKRASEGLRQTIARLARRKREQQPGVDVAPGCAFGAVADQRLREVEQSFRELKTRLNGLIFLVLGAVVVEVIMRLVD